MIVNLFYFTYRLLMIPFYAIQNAQLVDTPPPPPQKKITFRNAVINVIVKWEITSFRPIYKRNRIYHSLWRELMFWWSKKKIINFLFKFFPNIISEFFLLYNSDVFEDFVHRLQYISILFVLFMKYKKSTLVFMKRFFI